MLSPATLRAACEEASVLGSWQLQGSGQSLAQGETCAGSAELVFESGGVARFSRIQVACQQDAGYPADTALAGRYTIQSGCQGQMNVGGQGWFVVVGGGQELMLIRSQGNVTMSWRGAREASAQPISAGAQP